MKLNYGLRHLEVGVESAGYSISSKVNSMFSFLFELPDSIYRKSFGSGGVEFYAGHLDMDLQRRDLSGKTLTSDSIFEYVVNREFSEGLMDEHNNEVGKVQMQSIRHGDFLNVKFDWSGTASVAALKVSCTSFSAKFSDDLSNLIPSKAASSAVIARTKHGAQAFEVGAKYSVGEGTLLFTHKHFVVQNDETWMSLDLPMIKSDGSVFGGTVSVIYYMAESPSIVADCAQSEVSKCYLERMGRRRSLLTLMRLLGIQRNSAVSFSLLSSVRL
uniref:Uncharacterized protein n=1 Tax=Tobacco rattle virus (strain SYM) TaxID=12298 RepID=G0LXX2_TRVSY|nr:hypothetical protein [Tobacco rattle virus-SYM]